jgi:glycosyltransferase involved in cell wall biosynthesis
VVPSGYLVDEFADFGLAAVSVYNVVDLSRFIYRQRSKFEPKIIVARNLEELYNIPVALKAYKIVKESYPDAVLTIVGDGRAEEQIKEFAAREGIADVDFTGRVERREMTRLFDRHDIFLNSSEIDNMPLSFLEAYSVGLAVVSTDAGGIPYICENCSTGLLAKRGDYRALADNILKILEDKDCGKNLTENALEVCQQFSWKQVRSDWYRLYSDLYNAKK